MAKKKTRKDYDYYTMNFPNELRFLFEAYIMKYKSLGFKNVSQFALHLLQEEAKKIMISDPEISILAKKLEELKKSGKDYSLVYVDEEL